MLVSQSCLTLCDPMVCSLPGSFVHDILQARILEWVAMPFCRGSSQPRDGTLVSCTAGRFFTVWVTREAHTIQLGASVFSTGECEWLTLPSPYLGEGNGNPLQYSCLDSPWVEEPGGLQSMGSLRVGHDWATSLSLFTFPALEKEMATHSSVLAWRIPGTGEPGGLPSLGSHRVRHDWSDLAAARKVYWFAWF